MSGLARSHLMIYRLLNNRRHMYSRNCDDVSDGRDGVGRIAEIATFDASIYD